MLFTFKLQAAEYRFHATNINKRRPTKKYTINAFSGTHFTFGAAIGFNYSTTNSSSSSSKLLPSALASSK